MIAPTRPGELIQGKYRVQRVLGTGGMGTVVLAMHEELEENVALKFLLPEAAQDELLKARFLREARSATRIKSEHVVRILDVVRLDDGVPFLVMEYLEGQDVASWLLKHGTFSVSDTAECMMQACEALAVAHSMGIVHRDIKPANLFMTRRPDGSPVAKILDFGISKAALTGKPDDGDLSLTKSTTTMGSPLYMSPEQMHSARDVDHRADIWSLGSVMYEMLTGTTAFEGDSITRLCIAVLHDPPRPMRLLRPDLPPELEAVVLRCLEKQREQRFGDVAELAAAIAPFAPARSRHLAERAESVLRLSPPISGEQPGFVIPDVSAEPAPLSRSGGGTMVSAPAAATASGMTGDVVSGIQRARSGRARSRSSVVWIAGGVASLFALVAGAALMFRGRPTPAVGLTGHGVAPSSSSAAPLTSDAGTTCTVRLDSTPRGATVYDGDRVVGVTPTQHTLDNEQVQARPLLLVFKMPGYRPFSVAQGPCQSTTEVVADLTPEGSPPSATTAADKTKPVVRLPPPAKKDVPKPVIREER